MAEKLEQRAVVKFYFLLGKTAGETVVMLETTYKEAALGKTQVYEWFSCFRNGELSLADQPRSGRSSTSRTDENIARILGRPSQNNSLDLAPGDFFLFPRMKKVLEGKRFADIEEVKKKTTEALNGITLQEFQDCFKKWKTRLDRCIASNGEYFEVD